MKKRVHAFIISWTGVHENSLRIADEIYSLVERVTIVYSDRNVEFNISGEIEAVKVSDELFWGGKFAECLNQFESDIFFQIQGDCKSEDWKKIVHSCAEEFEQHKIIGVWSPIVYYTDITPEMTILGRFRKESLLIVTCTDGLVFGLSKDIIARMRTLDYSRNKFGWGIERAMAAFAYTSQKIVVLDSSVNVSHPKGRGYNSHEASVQYFEFLNQLSLHERLWVNLMASHMQLRLSKTQA